MKDKVEKKRLIALVLVFLFCVQCFTDGLVSNIIASEEPIVSVDAVSVDAVSGDAVSGDAVSGNAVSGGAVSGGAVSGGAVSGGAVSGGTVEPVTPEALAIDVIPYIGECDHANHDAVTVSPSAIDGILIEYKLEGNEYSTTIPQICEVGDYIVWVRATRQEDNTQLFENSYPAKISESESEHIVDVTAYVGDYDHTNHDAVTVTPVAIDGILIEYKLEGEEYSTTIPQICDSGDYIVWVRATRQEDNTKLFEVKYYPKINKLQPVLSFDHEVTYFEFDFDARYFNLAHSNIESDDIHIKYSLKPEDLEFASIDKNTGEIKVYKEGEITVTASIEDSTNYVGTSISYSAKIERRNFVLHVNDGDKPVTGASVSLYKYYGEGIPGEFVRSVCTDNNGVALFSEIVSGTWSSNFYFVIKKDDYKDYTTTVYYPDKIGPDKYMISYNSSAQFLKKIPGLAVSGNSCTFNQWCQPTAVDISGLQYGDTLIVDNEVRTLDYRPTMYWPGDYTFHIVIKRSGFADFDEDVTAYVGTGDYKHKFTTVSPASITYSKDGTYTNTIADLQNGTVNYSSSNTNVATVDQNGTVHIKTAGDVTIYATIKEKKFKTDKVHYDLTIEKAERDGFTFTKFPTDKLAYNTQFQLEVGPCSGSALVTYSVENDGDTPCLSVDENGLVTVIGVGTGTAIATIDTDSCYKGKTIKRIITTKKAEQSDFKFESKNVYKDYGITSYQQECSGGITGSAVYSITDVTPSDLFDDFNKETGYITIADNKEGIIEITAKKAGNENYLDATASYVLYIRKQNADDSMYKVKGNKLTDSIWYTSKVELQPTSGYSLGYSNSIHCEESEWLSSIELNKEGKNTVKPFYIRGQQDHSISNSVSLGNIFIDTVPPDKEQITVSYSDVKTSLLPILFFGKLVKVTLTAVDETSGIDHFECSIKNFNGETIQYVPKDLVMEYSDETKTHATGTFTICKPFSADITYIAYDIAGNNSLSDKVDHLILDDEKPVIEVKYDNNDVKNDKYYDKAREATIKITEDNFYPEDVNLLISRIDPEGNSHTVTGASVKFNPVKDEENVYIAKYNYTEDGDYTFDISYKDKSDNTSDEYKTDRFTIDTYKPKISIDYDSKDFKNSNYSSKKMHATITVDEQCFDAALFESGLNITGYSGADLVTKEMTDYFKQQKNWTKDGSKYSIGFDLSQDAIYQFHMSYVDRAGNSDKLDDEVRIDTTAPEKPVISLPEPNGIRNTTTYFYNSSTRVVIGAKDNDEIDYIVYERRESGAEPVKTTIHKDGFTQSKDGISYEFTISPQFNGTVAVSVYDMAGNVTVYEDNRTIITDDISPVVSVTFDLNQAVNYYNTSRTATITINETNFYNDCVDVSVMCKKESESKSNSIHETCLFEKMGNDYVAKVSFMEDGEYSLSVSCVDPAKNQGNSYSSETFYIDTKRPVIDIVYDNNSATQGNLFNKSRTAQITLKEKYYDFSKLQVDLKCKSETGNYIDTSDLEKYLRDITNWKINGDEVTTSITFSKDGIYHFNLSYTDKAGNANEPINYNNSVAGVDFTIDQTKPSGGIWIGSWNASLSGETWNHVIAAPTWNHYSNVTKTVRIEANDSLTKISSIEYLISTTAISEADLAKRSDFKVWNEQTKIPDLLTDQSIILYVRLKDNAGNITYMSTDGIIIDKQQPVVELTTNSKAINDIYADDVIFDLLVQDYTTAPNTYSGIHKIEYSVRSLGAETQNGVLFEHLQTNTSNYKKESAIVIDKILNNSDDVKVVVTVTDNAGNKTEVVKNLMIDITKPTISVSFDNNVQDPNFDGYFKERRTATIVVTERNFDPQLFATELTKNGAAYNLTDLKWQTVKGNGNEDNTKHTAHIVFDQDGKYTIGFQMVDLAGNKDSGTDYMKSVAPTEFVIDQTKPIGEISFDNNSSINSNYYKAQRTATVKLVDENFETERIHILVTAVKDGKSIKVPAVSSFNANGNVHTASIAFKEDGDYTISLDYTDKAGNSLEQTIKHEFHVDKTSPELTITNIQDKSANRGSVAPVVTFSDINLDNAKTVVTLSSTRNASIKFNGKVEKLEHGFCYKFDEFEKKPDMDDLYELTVSVEDKAGNKVEKSITFSVNRFGSTYGIEPATKSINGKFSAQIPELVITEYNVDPLSEYRVVMYKNDQTIELVNDKDYYIVETKDSARWHKYEYHISDKNFADDGVYRIAVQSHDAAGNIAENTQDSKAMEVSFGVDRTNPIIIISNLKDGKTYASKNLTALMTVTDNLKLASVDVYLDDALCKNWTDITEEDIQFDIPGDSTKAHTIKIVATDAAGNQATQTISNFYVTTNLWVRFYNNKKLLYGTFSFGLILILGISSIIIVRKKRKTA